MFERFTDSARRVVVWAQEESRLLNHDHIGTEHLLLGLLHEDGETARALAHAGVSLVVVQGRLEQLHSRGTQESSGHIPFTPRAKKVLELALRVSQRLEGDTIGTPHMLRAVLDVPDSTAHQLLVGLDVDIDGLARIADDLARSDADTPSDEARHVRGARSASAAAFAGIAPVARRMSAREISASVADLADELARRHDRLAAGLRQYGVHAESCDPDSQRGCTCGFAELLADMDPG